MSDNIPLELQVEIIKRVPLKSLLQLRSVSKEWKALIDSPKFGDDYCVRHSQPNRLLIRCTDTEQYYYFWVADDDTFQQHKIPSTTLPESINNFEDAMIVGCSHGLVCFCGSDYRDGSPMAVLWNPWIRKCVDVPVPNFRFKGYQTILGFGVSPQTKDPKIVKINNYINPKSDTSALIPWRVEVFTLSSGTWKTPSCCRNNLPCRNSIIFRGSSIALDGVIYWHAFEMIYMDGRSQRHNLIMSFDLSSEGLEEVCLPDDLARGKNFFLLISKRTESVVVLEMDKSGTSCGVWMMGQGVTKSFTKLFTVMPRPWVSPYCLVCGFMKNGEPIVNYGFNALFAYDPYSERIKDLGIIQRSLTFSVFPYMETLLLIGQ